MSTAATPPATDMDSPILKIPLEILLRITYSLTTPELGKLRLTSRHFEQSLDPTFVNEFFTRKQFMISYESLRALIDISKSRLGPHLRNVHIGLDQFVGARQRRITQTRQDIRYRELSNNQFSLWQTGHHREMLVEAFSNLPNLRDVVIRDFNSFSRSRDGPRGQWRSYGVTTAFQETGSWLHQGFMVEWNQSPHKSYSSNVLQAVLYALGEAGARPKGIEVMSRASNHLWSCAFNVPVFAEPKMLPVLEHLEKLHIDIDASWPEPQIGWPTLPDIQDIQQSAEPSVQKFLLSCSRLSHLRINERHGRERGIGALLRWLGDSSPSAQSPSTSPSPSPTWPHLEELNLGSMNVEASWVLNMIRKYASTLKRLELWKLRLKRSIPADSASPPPKINFWKQFLEKLKDIPDLNLHHIKIGAIQQQWHTRNNWSLVSFRGASNTMQYTGPDWKHFVGEMILKVEVQWGPEDDRGPHGVVNSDDDDDDDEDSEMADSDGDGDGSEGDDE